MDKKLWLKIAAGWSFFMALCQTVISLSPTAAAYFQAPPPLLEDRWRLFLVGEGAALILVVFGLYALSGAGMIRRLPLLRLGLIGISSLYLLRGLFIVLSLLIVLGVSGRTAPDSGRNFKPGVSGSGDRLRGWDNLELERDAGPSVKCLVPSRWAPSRRGSLDRAEWSPASSREWQALPRLMRRRDSLHPSWMRTGYKSR